MTSTHCTDCPYHDSNNPSYCCSNAITPKPTDDYDNRAWQKAADHIDAIKRCKANNIKNPNDGNRQGFGIKQARLFNHENYK